MMNKKSFSELLSAVRGEDIWAVRAEECRAIVRELVDGDFDELHYGIEKITVQIAELPTGIMGLTIEDGPGRHRIKINKTNWEASTDFSKTGLRHIIKHELLHILTGEGDDDPNFKRLAREKGVDIWRV